MGGVLVFWTFVFLVLLDFGLSIRWLSLQHSNLHWNMTWMGGYPGRGIRSGTRSPCGVARRRYGLARLQAKLCRTSMEIMPHVQRAAVLAADTCRMIFQDRRWNCSSIVRAPYLTPDLTRATREQAYVYALSSAALTYTTARACASGILYHCTCAGRPDQTPDGNFQWGGCGDNIAWGMHFSKRFIDNVEKSNVNKTFRMSQTDKRFSRDENRMRELELRKEIALINLHNSRVGRRAAIESLQTQCKCHGVSGSCNIKTCWKGLPSMAVIGQRLLQKYTNAAELSRGNENLLRAKKSTNQLLYLTKSPDYCTKDDKLGSLGTVGRRCNVTTDGPNSCRQLCCGRGYTTFVEEKLERCQCRYYNCCYVKCALCRTKTKIYECS